MLLHMLPEWKFIRRILEAQKTIIALCAGFTTLMFLISNAAGTLFAQLFTSDPQIVSMVVRAIHISTLSVIPLGIQYEIVDGFTAMGRVRYSFALSFFRKFVYFTALFLLPRFFALENIFYVEPISDLIGPVVSMIVYWTSIQKILKQREEALTKIISNLFTNAIKYSETYIHVRLWMEDTCWFLSVCNDGNVIPNDFIVGYGLDYDGLGRNYRDIYTVIE